jgi:spore germination protein GerM
MRRLVAGAVIVAVGLGLGGCAIGPESEPRDIDREEIDELPLAPSGGGAAATGTGRVYLLAPNASGSLTMLQAVARDVGSDARVLLQALLAGPNTDELEEQFRTALPRDLRLLDVRRRAGGVLLVDVSDEITDLTGDALIAAVAQIVFTASALPDVRFVELRVEGATTQWPAGNGELRSEPLTVYDYPGIEPSTQPPYPGLPA